MPDYSTGISPLPTIGILAYNGVIFSSLYKSRIAGRIIPDNGHRTTKLTEYELDVEAYVTLGVSDTTTDNIMQTLRVKLEQHGGYLTVQGTGFGPLNVNPPVGGIGAVGRAVIRDVAWGPVPELIDFTPLGASRSALVHWKCKVQVVEFTGERIDAGDIGGLPPPLQFNWDYDLNYDAQGYSSYSIRGTLEIPLSRNSVTDRRIRQTVDDFRQVWLNIKTDLANFRVVRRHFGFSRDKRTCEWEFSCEQLPPMGLPKDCTEARGTMSVRNTGGIGGGSGKGKLGFIFWTMSLRCTYTVRGDRDQRLAYEAFYSLLWYRMQQSKKQALPPLANKDNAPQQEAGPAAVVQAAVGAANLIAGIDPAIGAGIGAIQLWLQALQTGQGTIVGGAAAAGGIPTAGLKEDRRTVLLTDFGFDEGLYLDSKTITFHASWWVSCTLASILRASGVWHFLEGSLGGNVWAASMQSVMGQRSWLAANLDPLQDVIVDFNGGTPPTGRIVALG